MQQQPYIKYLQMAFCKSYPGGHLQFIPFFPSKELTESMALYISLILIFLLRENTLWGKYGLKADKDL